MAPTFREFYLALVKKLRTGFNTTYAEDLRFDSRWAIPLVKEATTVEALRKLHSRLIDSNFDVAVALPNGRSVPPERSSSRKKCADLEWRIYLYLTDELETDSDETEEEALSRRVVAAAILFLIPFYADELKRGPELDVAGGEHARSSDSTPGSQVPVGKHNSRETPKILPFPTPEGADWTQVLIELVNLSTVRICIGENCDKRHIATLGFLDGRKEDASTNAWATLGTFARLDGKISWDAEDIDQAIRKRLRTDVGRIRKVMRAIFNISGDPFLTYRKERAYVTKFKIRLGSGFPHLPQRSD